MEKLMLRRKEAAKILAVCLPTLDKLISVGAIKVVRAGRAILIPVDALKRFTGR